MARPQVIDNTARSRHRETRTRRIVGRRVDLAPVFLGGCVGGAIRYAASSASPSDARFPWATLVVNLAGAFVPPSSSLRSDFSAGIRASRVVVREPRARRVRCAVGGRGECRRHLRRRFCSSRRLATRSPRSELRSASSLISCAVVRQDKRPFTSWSASDWLR